MRRGDARNLEDECMRVSFANLMDNGRAGKPEIRLCTGLSRNPAHSCYLIVSFIARERAERISAAVVSRMSTREPRAHPPVST